MRILIKRKEISALLSTIKEMVVGKKRSGNQEVDRLASRIDAMLILQLGDALGKAKDAEIDIELLQNAPEAIEKVFGVSFEQFIKQYGRLIYDSQGSEDVQQWTVSFFNDRTGEKIVRTYNYEPSDVYWNYKCKRLKVDRCVAKRK